MSVHIGWDESRVDVVHCDFVGVRDTGEYNEALEELIALTSDYSDSDLKVVVVITVVSSDDLPQVSVLRFMRNLVDQLEDRVVCLIIVAQDPLLDVLLHLITPFYKHFGIYLATAPTVGDALALIRRRFPS